MQNRHDVNTCCTSCEPDVFVATNQPVACVLCFSPYISVTAHRVIALAHAGKEHTNHCVNELGKCTDTTKPTPKRHFILRSDNIDAI